MTGAVRDCASVCRVTRVRACAVVRVRACAAQLLAALGADASMVDELFEKWGRLSWRTLTAAEASTGAVVVVASWRAAVPSRPTASCRGLDRPCTAQVLRSSHSASAIASPGVTMAKS